MEKLTTLEIEYIEKALTHHTNYKGEPADLSGVPMLGGSSISSTKYLRIMGYISMNNSGSSSQKLSKTLDVYFKTVGVNTLAEAMHRLKEIRNKYD